MAINVFDQTLSNFVVGTAPSLRWSRFAHALKRKEAVAILHSLTHQVLYFAQEAIDAALEQETVGAGTLAPDLTEKLVRNGMLVSSDYDEQAVLNQIRTQFLSRPSYDILYLLLTDACNLSCRYCVIEGNIPCDHRFVMMTEEIADRAITLFGQLSREGQKDSATIIFYGGEPLLNKRVFIHAVEKISNESKCGNLPANTRITLITNGTKIDDDVIDCCKQYGVGVSLSLDGPKSIHDANRIFAADGSGTFDRVMGALKHCQDRGLFPAVSCTINSDNIDVLADVTDWLIREKVTGMGFNLLVDLPNTQYSNCAYVTKATQGIIDAYRVGRQHGLYEDRVMRKVDAFVSKRLHLVDCGGCGHQIAVTPNGLVGPCHVFMPTCKYFPTTVWDADGYDFFTDQVFAEWVRRSPINIPECLDCLALGTCGGGCPYSAEAKRGTIWLPDPEFCIHSKMLLEWLVWELFDQEISTRALAQISQKGGDQ